MRMNAQQARDRFAAARVARLATADRSARPHLVPIVFALVGDELYFAVDGKPKTTAKLRRLDNIRRNPAVSVLVDHYSDDWNELWWARADGTATIIDLIPNATAPTASGLGLSAIALAELARRYPRYRSVPEDAADAPAPGPFISGPLVRIGAIRWSGWSARG